MKDSEKCVVEKGNSAGGSLHKDTMAGKLREQSKRTYADKV